MTTMRELDPQDPLVVGAPLDPMRLRLGTMDGAEAWSDGFYMEAGPPPALGITPDARRFVYSIADARKGGKYAPASVGRYAILDEPTLKFVQDPEKEGEGEVEDDEPPIVALLMHARIPGTPICAIQACYLNRLRDSYPSAVLFAPRPPMRLPGDTHPIIAWDAGRAVAAIMPYGDGRAVQCLYDTLTERKPE